MGYQKQERHEAIREKGDNMVSLITQCKFIDYTEGKEYVFSLDELKNKLKSYITENAANLIGEIEKMIIN